MKPLKQRAEEITDEIVISILSRAYITGNEAEEITRFIYNELIKADLEVRENIIEAIEEIKS